MKTWAQDFREKTLNFMKEYFGSNYTQYRFNKESNFISFENFQDEEAINRIIKLGKELEIIKELNKYSDEELQIMVNKWQSQSNHKVIETISIDQHNALFAKDQGINASQELLRRKNESYLNSKVEV